MSTEVTNSESYYTAGVVEFRPTIAGMTSADMLEEHLNAYLDIIESPEAEDIDIIVFPEGTLNNAFQLTYVPSEKENAIPCLWNASQVLYADFLVKLSCTARQVRKYLVINLTEKEDCSLTSLDPRPCAASGLNVYNTNVVFDREGRVVSRYRKVNIYVENKNTTLEPEYGIFDTDFGVRFGHFICFDILFYTPALELVQHYGIQDFIFTSLFYSELPFLTATQLQQGWAWGNNVNLLAAGASYPQSGTTGTGIYAGREGSLISVMVKEGEGERKLYKAQVPKVRYRQYKNTPKLKRLSQASANIMEETSVRANLSGIRLMKDPQIENYNSVLMDLTKSHDVFEELCHGDLCCSFGYNVEVLSTSGNISSHYTYRLGVFEGRRSYEKDQWSDIKVCAVYACANEDPHSCGQVPETEHNSSPIRITYLHIKGSFPKVKKFLIMPTTVDDELNPLSGGKFIWKNEGRKSNHDVDIWLTDGESNLLTFGIYAMYYSAGSLTLTSHIFGVSLVGYIVLIELYKSLLRR